RDRRRCAPPPVDVGRVARGSRHSRSSFATSTGVSADRPLIRALRLGLVRAEELRRLCRTLRKPGFLKDRRDLGVRREALPPRLVPVENRPNPVALIWILKDVRSLATVLLSLLSALGREGIPEAVEILDLRRCQDHLSPPCRHGVVRPPP